MHWIAPAEKDTAATTLEILKAMAAKGSPAPEFETDEDHSYFMVRLPVHAQAQVEAQEMAQVDTKSALSRHQVEILSKCLSDMDLSALMVLANRTDRTKFRSQVIKPLLADGLLAMTIPDKPTSSKQRYITNKPTIDEILPCKPEARPRIYAYAIADAPHQGLLKVGQTTRDISQRVARQVDKPAGSKP